MKLYHGTRRAKANKILTDGFKRSEIPSYTGTGVNLSESITIAYEYGPYESNGCVLEVELAEDANINDIGNITTSDLMFTENPGLDAINSYHGNVIVVWNTSKIKAVRILPKREAVKLLKEKFKEDGNNCAYNGFVQDHCEAYWGDNHA